MRILDLAFKDLSQILRDKKSLLFLLAMPLVFTIFMGIASGGAAKPQDPRLALGWVDQDPSGQLSQQLKTSLSNSSVVRLVEIDPAQAAQVDEQIRQGKIAAAVVIPAGFSQQTLSGKLIQLTVVTDELSTSGQSILQAVRGPVTRLMSAVEISQLDVAALEKNQAFPSASARQEELLSAFHSASQAWDASLQSGLQIKVEKAVGSSAASAAALGGNPYNQSSPGMLVMFAIFGLVTSANILVQERKTRTLQRLLTTSMKRYEIIAGHLLAMFAIVFMQEVILVVFGQFALKVDYMGHPAATLLVAVALGLWVASYGLLVSAFANDESQVTLYSLISMFIFSALGGAWFSLEVTSPMFATIGHLSPAAWAMDGFKNILIRGLETSSVIVPTGVMLLYALVFFGLAVWRFQKNEA
jgi:ABC-2 type transport system permease protein